MVEMNFIKTMKHVLHAFCLLSLLSVISPKIVFAEPAPVYDADALEQPYDNHSGEQVTQDLPPPPNQSGNESAAFIPIQSEVQPSYQSSGRGGHGLERRIRRIEQQISNMQGSDWSAQLESLQNQIQSLRAELEELTKAMHETQNQQKTMYVDFDNRLNQVASIATAAAKNKNTATNVAGATDNSSAAVSKANKNGKALANADASAAPSTNKAAGSDSKVAANASTNTDNAASPTKQPDVAEEQEIYQNAYNMIKNKKYNDAVNILQNMLQKYPSGQFASNAHYWLGELYGLLGKNDKALGEFDQVVRNFSDSPRVSDAMFKVGLIFAAQSRWNEAKKIFKRIVTQYPGTASSRLANEQLKQIKEAGH